MSQQDLNRRDFVSAAAMTAAALAAAVTIRPAAALGQAATQPSTTTIDVGQKSDYTKDGVTATWEDNHHILVVRQNNRIYAMSSKCTHRGCALADTGDHLNCPCHNSDFQYNGEVIDGPAKRALDHYAISIDDSGHLQVDTSKKFAKAKYDDPASFVSVS
jgi:nitrite reductase/ring-hydroxylating ferredoxin subunit